jgi:hypothetical protein
MSAPNDEIGRFGMGHFAEAFHTVVKIVGICVRIWKSSAFIDAVHQM